MKAIIIEDELASQDYLKAVLEKHFPEINVAAVTDNVPEAIVQINDIRPQIVFLDVEIRLGTGFDVLEQVKGRTFEVIFTTAFDAFAVKAFRHHAIDYLLKPLNDLHVIEATRRCLEGIRNSHQANYQERLLNLLLDPPVRRFRLNIPTLEGIEFVEFIDIVYAEARGNYTDLKLRTGKTIIITKKLKAIEEVVPAQQFFRIHNSYLVNAQYIKKYQKGRGGHVILHDGNSLPVAFTKKDDFLNWLK